MEIFLILFFIIFFSLATLGYGQLLSKIIGNSQYELSLGEIGFLGFFFMEMYFNDTFSPMKFFFLSAILLITIYSRINIGCKTLLDAIYCALVGLLMGVIYYNLIKDYYKADYLEEDITEINKDINNFFTLN